MSDTPQFMRFPGLDASDEEAHAYMTRYFNDDSTHRNYAMERMAMSIYYTIGRQWIELDPALIPDGVRGYHFRDIPQPEGFDMPRPVINKIAAALEVELAALSRRELIPNVISLSKDPKMEAAAKIAKEVLEHRMRVLQWPELRELVTFLTVVCGIGVLKSYWDETFSDLTLVGAPNAVRCPNCPTTLASREVNRDQMEGMKNTESAYKQTEESAHLNYCPTCDSPTPLIPMDMDEEQAMGTDVLGRPMGFLVPKGNTNLEVVSPFDIFPENGGLDSSPESAKVWGQATVRSLDWIEERYPEALDDLTTDDPATLIQYHPTLGEWTYLGYYSASQDSGIYQEHVRVYELHAEKSYRFPNGRSIVMLGEKAKKIVENGELYRTVDGVSVPRVFYRGAKFKPNRHREFWGQSMVDDLISPQNRINGIDAQLVESRDRLGSPNLLITPGMNIEGPMWLEDYGAGKFMVYTPDPLAPNAAPEPFPNQLMPVGVYEERDRIAADMKEIAGPQDIEQGEAPRNISTTSGLQLLGEKAESRRALREHGLVNMYEAIWNHQVRLLWTLRTESDDYEMVAEDGRWEVKQYDRNAMQGQYKVVCEKQAFIEKSIYQKEAVREALADGLIQLNSQAAIKRMLELMDLPTDINEDLNRQVDLSKHQWVDFLQEAKIPYIDTSLDDPHIHFAVLGTCLQEDEGVRLQEEVGWPQLMKQLTGWEVEYQVKKTQDDAAVQFYGGRLSEEEAAPVYEQAQIGYQQAQADFEAESQAAAQAASAGVPQIPPEPPQPPPAPVFLPPAREDQILVIWTQILTRGQVQLDPSNTALLSYLKFRAVVEAYKLMAEEKDLKMQMGMPQMQAPGTSPPGGPPNGPGTFPGAQPPPNPPNPTNVPNGRNRNLMQGVQQ